MRKRQRYPENLVQVSGCSYSLKISLFSFSDFQQTRGQTFLGFAVQEVDFIAACSFGLVHRLIG
jgi:hypothetical protein